MANGKHLMFVQVIVSYSSSGLQECGAHLVVWPLVMVFMGMATLLTIYAIVPLGAPYQYKLLYHFAVLPKLFQALIVCITVMSLTVALAYEDAYGCTNHRLYVAEWLYALASAYFGSVVGSVFLCCCPIVGFALPLPDYNFITEDAVKIRPPLYCPSLKMLDYRPFVAVAVTGMSLAALGVLLYLTL